MSNGERGYHDPDAPWNLNSDQNPASWNGDVIAEFRASAGRVDGDYDGVELILLTTTGARSGVDRVVPLAPNYRDGTLYVSSFREDRDPDWVHNIRANPAVVVEIGDQIRPALARALTGTEYDEFSDWVRHHNPLLSEFQQTIDRPVPLVTIHFS